MARKSAFGLNLDQHVFSMLLLLTTLFLFLFIFGTSMPAWYVIQEPVNNLSTCTSAEKYVDDIILRSWPKGETKVKIGVSLWYLYVQVQHQDIVKSRVIPFYFLQRNNGLSEGRFTDFQPETTLSRSVVTLFTFIFLALGVMSALLASSRPSRQIYYGLSGVFLVSGTSTWVSLAVPASQEQILSAAVSFCVTEGLLTASLFLQILTIACAIVSFILACILIHFSLLRLHVFNAQQDYEYENEIESGMTSKFNILNLDDADEAFDAPGIPVKRKLLHL